jgi:hypothetical protein
VGAVNPEAAKAPGKPTMDRIEMMKVIEKSFARSIRGPLLRASMVRVFEHVYPRLYLIKLWATCSF